jgi:mannose PTS system EIIA component
MIKIIIITHGNLGKELLATAESLTGKQENVMIQALGANSLNNVCTQTEDILRGVDQSQGALVLTDMLGGTPCNACLPYCDKYNIEIVTGINLYMLLSSFMHRGSMGVKELSQKVIQDGRKNITNAKEMFLQKLK